MLKQLLVSSALLTSFFTQADVYLAGHYYHQENYQQAKAEFERLLPLGNELAAFNLAVMAMKGQGMEQDLPLAYRYFLIAADLGHSGAAKGLNTLDAHLTAAQKQQIQQQLALQEKQWVPSYATMLEQRKSASVLVDHSALPEVIERVEPKYPVTAARKGTQGFASVRFLIDEQGEVVYAQTQHSFPAGVFDEVSEQAIRQWRYQPSPDKSIRRITLDFKLAVGGQAQWRKILMHSLVNDSWPAAKAGVVHSQYSNAILLNYLDQAAIGSVDLTQSTEELPKLSDFKSEKAKAVKMPAFNGSAMLTVDPDKKLKKLTILSGEVPFAEGDTLSFINKAGDYKIAPWDLNYNTGKAPLYAKDKMYLRQIHQRPKEWTDEYWLDQAARNGLLEAQRARAQFDQGWAHYLQRQNDPVALGWQAIQLLTEDKTDEAKAVFSQAKAAGFEATAELEILFQ
jgi:TonB family protein